MVFLQFFLVLIGSFSLVSSTDISTNTSAVAEDIGAMIITFNKMQMLKWHTELVSAWSL